MNAEGKGREELSTYEVKRDARKQNHLPSQGRNMCTIEC